MSERREIRGVGVSPGLACAPALVLDWGFPDVPDRSVGPDEVDGELRRLHDAVQAVADYLNVLRERVLHSAGLEESRIFDAQILMVQDPDFLASVELLIRKNHLSAETAFEFKALELRVALSGTSNVRLRERLADVSAVQIRVLRHLMGHQMDEVEDQGDGQMIVVAHELAPGLTVQLDRDHLVGLVSEEGTRTSHAAILAHSLGIPAVMGAKGALDQIQSGRLLLIDGQTGLIVIDPTPGDLEIARTRASRRHKLEAELEGSADQPSVTPDGRSIVLMGNVDLPEEIDLAVRHGARGVGLLRTEFMVTGRAHLPTEEEQLEYFRRVGAAFLDHTLIIRTYDLGGDKFPAAFEAPPEANPFLGWRSIRVCLDRPEIFRPQLRAILRVAADRKIRIMLPLVTRVDEVVRAKEILAEEAENLARAGIRAASTVPVGVMIETPAAVVIIDRLAEVSAFFSIGTNDLTQYTLAVDRGSAHLASRFTPLDPAVLRQLDQVLTAGQKAGIMVSVCGEMASEPLSALLLIGMGFDNLSVAPPALPLISWMVRKVPWTAAREAAQRVVQASSVAETNRILQETAARFIDLRIVDLDPDAPLPGRVSGATLQL